MNFGYDSRDVFRRADELRCPKWRSTYQNFSTCETEIIQSDRKVIVKGMLKGDIIKKEPIGGFFIKYWAASPPTRGYSFTGSGLPYPNPEVAFKGTNNKGILPILMGRWSIEVDAPNSFYSDLGTVLNPPTVYFSFINMNGERLGEVFKIELTNPTPYRYLTWYKRDWNKGSLFYENPDMPLNRTQEQILMDSAYPINPNNPIPANFWGTRPPV